MKCEPCFMKVSVVFAVTVALFGCGDMPRKPISLASPAMLPQVGHDPDMVFGESQQDEVTIAPGNMYIAVPVAANDPLPNYSLKNFSFADSNPTQVIRTLLADTDISVVVRNETPNSMVLRHAVTAKNISGRLQDVMDRLSDSVGFFYTYRNGVLEVTPDMQFIVDLPPLNSVFESLPQMLKALGATDIFLDKSARTMTYRATKPVHEKISHYLTHIRENKSLIVYDTYIWEVVLSDSNSLGIDWNRFNYRPNGKFGFSVQGAAPDIPGSLGLGVVYNTASFTLDALARFLKTQGTLTTVSQPKLTLISGGTAHFTNGTQIDYVSQVGATSNANTTTTSATTSRIQEGVTMNVSGDISDSTVWTKVEMQLTAVQRFNEYTAVGTQLKLPQMSNKGIDNEVRTRSGDTILLAGINSIRVQRDDQGMPIMGDGVAKTSARSSVEKTEMVIVMRPRVIRFVKPNQKNAGAPATAVEAPVIREIQPVMANVQNVGPTKTRGPSVEVLQRRPLPLAGGDSK